jgi:methylamine dehydrogenase accessory protein MauD
MEMPFVLSYVLLWILAILLVLATLAILRELALLRLRVGPEPGALATNDGPKVGAIAPRLAGPGLDGALIEVETGPALLVFVSPSCRPCRELLPHLAKFVRSESIRTYVVGQGTPAQIHELASAYEINASVVVDADNEISKAFDVNSTPYGIALDVDWAVRSKGVTNSAEHLAGLASFQITLQGPRVWVPTDGGPTPRRTDRSERSAAHGTISS